MKCLRFLFLFAVIVLPLSAGCGGGGGVAAPAADKDELAAYLEENPNSGEDLGELENAE